jgi:uncharacterized Zn-binding protein involved in type VI secretion
MTKILSTIIGFIFFGSIASAQLTEFSQGDILSAGAMNQNFKYLEDRFGGLNEKTIECGNEGSGINQAIKEGYNSLIINGTCKENIKLDHSTGFPNILRLKGKNNDPSLDKIIDNSSNSLRLISLEYTNMILRIDNLTVSGGLRGINSWGQNTVWLENVVVNNHVGRGVHLWGKGFLNAYSTTVDGGQNSSGSNEIGFSVTGGSYAYLENVTSKNNSRAGIRVSAKSYVEFQSGDITGNLNGVEAYNDGKFHKVSWNNGTLNLQNNNDFGIQCYQAEVELDTLTNILNFSGSNDAFHLNKCDGRIKDSVISGGNGTTSLVGINASRLILDNVTIKNHQGNLLNVHRSTLQFRNSNLFTNESSSSECLVYMSDTDFRFEAGTTINGNNNTDCSGMGLYRSRGEIEDINVTSAKDAIYAVSSDVRIKGGTFSSSGDAGITIREGSRFRIESGSSNLSITTSASGEAALEVRSNSYVRLEKGSNSFSIDATGSTNDSDIMIRGNSSIDFNNHTHSNVAVISASFAAIDDTVTITKLICSNDAVIDKDSSTTITDTSGCSQAQ